MGNLLAEKIIDSYEKTFILSKAQKGNRTFKIQQTLLDQLGRQKVLDFAKELEELHLVKVNWYCTGFELESVQYQLEKMGQFYALTNRKPINEIMEVFTKLYVDILPQIRKVWIRCYVEEKIERYQNKESNKNKKDSIKSTEYQTRLEMEQAILRCFLQIDQLEEPIFKRVFSMKVFRKSKTFESEYEKAIISIAKRYNKELDEGMKDSEILSMLYIEDYGVELHLKGNLQLQLEGNVLSQGSYRQGTILNSETLKYATICAEQSFKRIIIFENKANFFFPSYEEDTLYLFSHGYFSPLECKFLQQLNQVVQSQGIEVYHSGDLDYGGIRIYHYIKSHIFPNLQPYQMTIDLFETYHEFVQPMDEETYKKLDSLQEPDLEEVIEYIKRTKNTLEQEAFLVNQV